MGKALVLVGGGHAHLTCLKRLKDFLTRGHQVTLIGPDPYHYYSGMGPGMLAGTYQPREIRFHIKKMVEDAGGKFVMGTVDRIDHHRRRLHLTSGHEVEFEVVSFNIGSSVPVAEIAMESDENVLTVKPIINLLNARHTISDLLQKGEPRLLVVGGGPAGLEVAGNGWRLVNDQGGKAHITLLAGRRALAAFPDKVRRLALESCQSRGIEVCEGPRLSRLQSGRAFLDDGRELGFDLALLALGVKPAPIFADSGLPTGADGGLLVNAYLHSVATPDIFGGGDCISFKDAPLDKVGVYAVRQNPVLYHNLMASLEERKLQAFNPGGTYLLIFNLGDGRGLFCRKNWVWDGPLAFRLKDWIDRRFMRKFQVSGELKE